MEKYRLDTDKNVYPRHHPLILISNLVGFFFYEQSMRKGFLGGGISFVNTSGELYLKWGD